MFFELLSSKYKNWKTINLVSKLVGSRVLDLIFHLPTSVITRHYLKSLNEAQNKTIITARVRIEKYEQEKNLRPYKVICSDICADSFRELILVFFNSKPAYIKKLLPIGEIRTISGEVSIFKNQLQIVHPDRIGMPNEVWQGPEPIYPLTAGVTNRALNALIKNVLFNIPKLKEWIPNDILKQEKWPSWNEAIIAVHNPKSVNDISCFSSVRKRLAFDELLANQLALKIKKYDSFNGTSFQKSKQLREKVLNQLPFKLTKDQEKALEEIDSDMFYIKPMARLLQGDVGCGKTIVAFLALLNAIEQGFQAAILSPTELLAKQHKATFEQYASLLGLKIELFARKTNKKIKAALKNGEINIAVGTHAIFEENIEFQNLGIAIIDEQHRFGVNQRAKFISKGANCDVLYMSATPIPRTLLMALHGDLNVSFIKTKPEGRAVITTRATHVSKINDVITRLKNAHDDQIYWVCPLIEESEKLDLAAAQNRFNDLQQIFGEEVGLVHGKMKNKDDVINNFRNKKIRLLVTTTVLEVGIDVPNATIMVIEHAERFGLAQLHQLRGRIGRGTKPSSCLLLYNHLSAIARERIKIFKNTDDGFEIAEADLKLRGAGDILGTQQSGFKIFKLVDPIIMNELLPKADTLAEEIMKTRIDFVKQPDNTYELLLKMFERYICSGERG